MTKLCNASASDWDTKLLDALWAYRVAYKVTTRFSPFQLVYGQEVILPLELEVPFLRTAVAHNYDWDGAVQQRLEQLEKLDETRLLAFQAREVLQRQRKKWYDRHLRAKSFQEGDLVLLYESKYWKRPGKLKIRWIGPYRVKAVNINGSVKLEDFAVGGIREYSAENRVRPLVPEVDDRGDGQFPGIGCV
ncbi:uncharacterized protein LOC112341110 [Selaginella moellendorffii]|uniref:uncharacterized protein LOC112341110 n=1 Tax=Selaginella moellendorffii TaxID=88036 RepID=UPI000D1C9F7E|nr:uncharacterized protein LOC112341110 [Selaginella moellendorffii]|eukprot:XP_024516387.1 uncharacterized protein LOC112341110 [Selaginella moellendorffii]